jgi:hypothetical protein
MEERPKRQRERLARRDNAATTTEVDRKPKARIQEGIIAAVKPLGLSPNAAADVAGVRPTTMFEAISTGRLRAKKWNGRTLILLRDLEAFLESLPDRPITRGDQVLTAPPATDVQRGALEGD